MSYSAQVDASWSIFLTPQAIEAKGSQPQVTAPHTKKRDYSSRPVSSQLSKKAARWFFLAEDFKLTTARVDDQKYDEQKPVG
jgi:hypothetical protein